MKKKTDIKNALMLIRDKNVPFDDYVPNKLYKIYNDGGHYVARVVENSRIKRNDKRYNEMNDYFDKIYFDGLDKNFTKNELVSYIRTELLLLFPDTKNIEEYIDKRLWQKSKNYYSRIKRFKRKANLNFWNYYVTFTYDSKKQTEESFQKRLRKCLSNLHTRKGWKFMGVRELSPVEKRVHYHFIMYIPDGQMVGNIKEIKDYSTKQQKIQITHSNSFFAERFGRNDFEELKEEEIRNGNALEYLIKYLNKTNEKIIYSRGIPTEIYKFIKDTDIATKMFDFVTKYVLFDDVIDCKRDVMHFKWKQATLFDNLHMRL